MKFIPVIVLFLIVILLPELTYVYGAQFSPRENVTQFIKFYLQIEWSDEAKTNKFGTFYSDNWNILFHHFEETKDMLNEKVIDGLLDIGFGKYLASNELENMAPNASPDGLHWRVLFPKVSIKIIPRVPWKKKGGIVAINNNLTMEVVQEWSHVYKLDSLEGDTKEYINKTMKVSHENCFLIELAEDSSRQEAIESYANQIVKYILPKIIEDFDALGVNTETLVQHY